MNNYLAALVLLVNAYSFAMDSDEEFLPGGKRGRSLSPESGSVSVSSASVSFEDDNKGKQTRVARQSSVTKSSIYAVDPDDAENILSFSAHLTFKKAYMRKLIARQGATLALVRDQLEALWHSQDADELDEKRLKKFCMKCPGCDSILQTDGDEHALFKAFFGHWFLTRQHQPNIFDHMLKLHAKSKQQAYALFKSHGLPKAAVVPLPHLITPAKELEQQLMEIDDEQELAQSEWYIVEAQRETPTRLTTFIAGSQESVISQYITAQVKMPLYQSEFEAQVAACKQNEELVKQLMVQDNMPGCLVCPLDVCDEIVEKDDSIVDQAEAAAQLFERLVIHHIIKHQVNNGLQHRADLLVAPSFDEAREKCQKLGTLLK